MPNIDEDMVRDLRQTVHDLAAKLRTLEAENAALQHLVRALTVGRPA